MKKSLSNRKALSRKEMESILGGNGAASCVAACACGTAVLCSSPNCEAVDGLGCNNGGATWKFCQDESECAPPPVGGSPIASL